jgi:hypothetical protein
VVTLGVAVAVEITESCKVLFGAPYSLVNYIIFPRITTIILVCSDDFSPMMDAD